MPGVSGDFLINKLEFPAAYTSYMQITLASTLLGDADTTGSLKGEVSIRNNAPSSLHLVPESLVFHDKKDRMHIAEMNGDIYWTPAGVDAPYSRLTWAEGGAFGLSGGAASMEFVARGPNFALMKPTKLPILDGALAIDTLSMGNLGASNMEIIFEGEVEPISMPRLATVFGWLGRTQNAQLRPLLEDAAGRLASTATAELVRLITVHERDVAAEAIRRAGALRTPAAVAPLGKVLGSDDRGLRLLAVQAVWDYFRSKLVLRAQEPFATFLQAADAFAWACYAPMLARYGRQGIDRREPPLVALQGIQTHGLARGDDGVVVADLAVVEHTLRTGRWRLQQRLRERRVVRQLRQRAEHLGQLLRHVVGEVA